MHEVSLHYIAVPLLRRDFDEWTNGFSHIVVQERRASLYRLAV